MKKPNHTRKSINRNIITFESGDDNKALVLAKLGMSNAAIKARTGLSDGQITYRLTKAKVFENNEQGYRVAFRNGVSQEAVEIIRDMQNVINADIQRNLVPLIAHPTPQTVEVSDD